MNEAQLSRYSRHLLLPEIGTVGQQKLLDARVLIVGLGGLGSPIAMYLAASGVGKLAIADYDTVDLSNLQRQIIHATPDVGAQKVLSAQRRINALNPDVEVIPLPDAPDEKGIAEQIDQADVIVDASDNFITRYTLNRLCLNARTPLVSGAAVRLEGQVTVFDFRKDDSPCYACLYGEEREDEEYSCSEVGVLAAVPGVIGTIQAVEVLKLLLGRGESLVGSLLLFDAGTADFRRVRLVRDEDCVVCGEKVTMT